MYTSSKYISVIFIIFLLLIAISCNKPDISKAIENGIEASIFPDYTNIAFPFNIAPLNFIIKDKADNYFIEIKSINAKTIQISSGDGNIKIPEKKWKHFIEQNKGNSLTIDIYTENNGVWVKYNSIKNFIAPDEIDSYIVYRFINSANIVWDRMGIYQRNIENFEVTPIMDNAISDNNCMHCHSFAANKSDNFMLHMRGKHNGTIIYSNNELKFIDTKTDYTLAAGAYPAWHPSGRYIAFSTNKINQRFHAIKEKYAFVYDKKSDIVMYDVAKNEIQEIPKLKQEKYENMPSWSADGKYLYFLSGELFYLNDTNTYKENKYDLQRISYNIETNTWGEIEDVLMASKLGESVAFPRISPDNKHIVFCLAEYGYFTVFNETSDIAIFDLETRTFYKPEINSDGVESYPSWSSNGKWIMFNSKRADGITSRPYFSYFNDSKTHKPFILPQEDAMWNIEELNNINRPEFVTSKVPVTPQKILKLIKEDPKKVSFKLENGATNQIKSESHNEENASPNFQE